MAGDVVRGGRFGSRPAPACTFPSPPPLSISTLPSLSTATATAGQSVRSSAAGAAADVSADRQQIRGRGVEEHDANPITPPPRSARGRGRGGGESIPELARRLLSPPGDGIDEHHHPLREFERVLASVRDNQSLLRSLQLSPSDARNMLILPPRLLKDVRAAIAHFGDRDNFQGTVVPLRGKPHRKTPGPMLCARLLELIGVPHYYLHASLASLPGASHSGDSPVVTVHSSQVDLILGCCLDATVALSRSCDAGKHSLIGSDFNFAQNSNAGLKSAAQLAEEIWRSVRNTEVRHTSGRRGFSHIPGTPANHSPPVQTMRIGRIGRIQTSEVNPLAEYLLAEEESAGRWGYNPRTMPASGATWVAKAPELEAGAAWSSKDQRRHGISLVLFNSALACYSKLSSSKSGTQPDVRRDNLLSAERLLLEAASSQSHRAGGASGDPPPSAVLRRARPDTVSFNTVMAAWAAFSLRRGGRHGADGGQAAAANAARVESILATMRGLWDEERAARTTPQGLRLLDNVFLNSLAQEGRGGARGRATPPGDGPVAPNASSYNTALGAWARCSDPVAAQRALEVYQTCMSRCNVACLARESLALGSSELAGRRIYDAKPGGRERVGDAFPDSRTVVLLLQSLQKLSSSIGFRDALDTVEFVFESMKRGDEQLHWSIRNGISPLGDSCLNEGGKSNAMLNVYSYNTMINTLSNLPTNWEESHHCCNRIDDLIEEMKAASSPLSPDEVFQCLPNAIAAWAKCSERAGDDRGVKLCAERAGAHVDELLAGLTRSDAGDDNPVESYVLRAINDAIALYGRAGMPSEADRLFARAGARGRPLECRHRHIASSLLSNLIDALCENGSIDIGHVERAHEHLVEVERDAMQSGPSQLPDMKFTSMYNAVLSGFVNCDRKARGLERARALLAHMVASHESNARHIARPNTTSFAIVMSALAQRSNHTSELESLLNKMESLHRRSRAVPNHSTEAPFVANVAPNVVIYNLLLKSYARSNNDAALRSAMELLGRMEKDPAISPDDVSNSYILALLNRRDGAGVDGAASNAGKKDIVDPSSTGPDLGVGNFDLIKLKFNGQNQPTAKWFNSIMNVHTTTGTVEGAEKGAALLLNLEEKYASGEINFKPDIYLHNKVMNAWKLCEHNKDPSMNLPSVSYARNAQAILDSICERREKGGEDEITPNDVSFSICIHAWCKSDSPDATERAEQLLRRKGEFAIKCEEVKIKSTDYNSVISKWKDDTVNGTERATLLFEEILRRYSNSEGRAKPTAATLNALLDVYAKSYQHESNLAEKAETYLSRMNELHKEGRGCILPDAISYRIVMDAWIRRWHKDSPRKVDALVKEMVEKYKHEGRKDLRPDSKTLNLVLKACAHAPAMWKEQGSAERGSDHPIAIGNRIFSELKGKNEYDANPTHSTYSFMFHIYRQHMDFRDKRYATLMQNMWKHCCRDGLVSAFSLESFRESVLIPDFFKAVGGKDKFAKTMATHILVDDLPKEWSRNVTPLKNRGKKAVRKEI